MTEFSLAQGVTVPVDEGDYLHELIEIEGGAA